MLQRMPNVDAASARQGSPEPRVPNHMKPRRSCTMAETTFWESPSAIVRCRNATRSCASREAVHAAMSSSQPAPITRVRRRSGAPPLVESPDVLENVPPGVASGQTLVEMFAFAAKLVRRCGARTTMLDATC